jgi:hypothetical protein
MAKPDLCRAHRSLGHAQSILGPCAGSLTPADPAELADVVEFIETALRHLGRGGVAPRPTVADEPIEAIRSLFDHVAALEARVAALEEGTHLMVPEVAELDDVG